MMSVPRFSSLLMTDLTICSLLRILHGIDVGRECCDIAFGKIRQNLRRVLEIGEAKEWCQWHAGGQVYRTEAHFDLFLGLLDVAGVGLLGETLINTACAPCSILCANTMGDLVRSFFIFVVGLCGGASWSCQRPCNTLPGQRAPSSGRASRIGLPGVHSSIPRADSVRSNRQALPCFLLGRCGRSSIGAAVVFEGRTTVRQLQSSPRRRLRRLANCD